MSRKEKSSKNQKKRKPPWILGVTVFLLFTFLLILQPSNLWKYLNVDSASDTLLLYALSSLNFFAFIIFAFILIRSLLKLRQERKAFQLGSKLKTKLLIYFAGVTILPLIAMAIFSFLYMNRALDRWFTQIPENAVREVGLLQNRSMAEQKENFRRTTAMLAGAFEKKEISTDDLQKIVRVGNLVHLELISENKEKVAATNEGITPSQKQQLEKLLTFFAPKQSIGNQIPPENELEFAKTELPDGQVLYAVVDLRSEDNIFQIAERSLKTFDSLKSEQKNVRQLALTTLGLLTFLLIFAASWFAFYTAKGLTRPIKALAEGAEEIAGGNFAHRVDVLAEDELELLVAGFNEMSAKLEENSLELQERRKYIETVLQSLSTGVISFNGENQVTTINKAAIEMLKLEEADFVGMNLEQLVSQENSQTLATLISRAKRIGQASEQTVLQREFIGGRSDIGENLPVALTSTALPDENGVVLVIEDLTELITAQRATAWQEVARRMAHEIKNPLTPIQLSAERIAKRFDSKNGDPGKEDLGITNNEAKENKIAKVVKEGTDTILREVTGLKMMVDEFSRYARLPNVKLKEGDLNELIKQSTLLYEDRTEDLKIETNFAGDLPELMIDSEQLKRVFVNLIDNSIEAFEEDSEEKVIHIKTFRDNVRDLVVTEVSDNGRGIDPSGFQKLFQPYFSTKGRGTGLGLAIVQRIISEHGGKIKAVSNNPKGARFIIELPV